MRMQSNLGVEVVVKVGVQLLVRLGGWVDKMKIIINSNKLKLKLKLELSLAKDTETVAPTLFPVDCLTASNYSHAARANH